MTLSETPQPPADAGLCSAPAHGTERPMVGLVVRVGTRATILTSVYEMC